VVPDEDDQDDDDLTPVLPDAKRAAMSSLAFASLASALVARLESKGGAAANELAAEGRALATTFQQWSSGLPNDAQYGPAIETLIAFNQSALDLLAG
jgi:hypothetical protein